MLLNTIKKTKNEPTSTKCRLGLLLPLLSAWPVPSNKK